MVVGLCVPGLWLLSHDGLPATHDGHLHILRLVQLESLRGDGVWFTRWLPDAAYGFGMPVFAFYAPLSYVGAITLELLGLPIIVAYKLSTAMYVGAAALGMYALCRVAFGRPAALAAAVVYAYAPYMLTNVYVRGAYAEVAVAAWLPFATLGVVRLANRLSRWWLTATAVSTAGLVLTHNVTALLFLPALVALAGVLTGIDWRALGRCGAGLALGLAMAAWFWIPALAERGDVWIEALIEPELFASFFIREWPMTQTSLAVDHRAPVSEASGWPIYWPRVGLVQALIGIAGAVAAATVVRTRLAAWALGVAAVCVVGQLAPARPVFEFTPLLAFVQFPWRLLLPLGLAIAILAAVVVQTLGRARLGGSVALAIVVTATIWSSTAALEPEWEYPRDEFLTVDALAALDLGGVGVGTTHGGEYLPRTSGLRNANRFWKELREADGGSPRGERGSMAVTAAAWRANAIDIAYSAERTEPLTFRQFWFPGWRAWLDGVEVPTRAGGRFGQLTVDAPSGHHRLELRFDWTPTRLAALGVSVIAMVATLGTFASRRSLATILLAAMTACGPVQATSSTGDVRPVRISEDLTLLDAAIESSNGGTILRSVWHSHRRAPLPVELQATVGQRELPADGRQAGLLMRTWDRNEIVAATRRIVILADAGTDAVEIASGESGGLTPRVVGHLQRRGSNHEPAPVELDGSLVARAIAASFGPVARGEPLDVDVGARGVGLAGRDVRVALALGEGVGTITTHPTSIGSWYLPATRRTAHDVVRQRLRLNVPATFPPGQHRLVLRAAQADLPWAGIAPFASIAPERAPRWETESPIGTVSVR